MKKLSKTLVVLSVCACAAVSAGVFAACDDPAHTTHDYGDWVVTNPTDEDTGSAVKTCNKAGCDQKTVTVTLPVLGDSAYSVSGSAATCVDAGETTYTLPNDGDAISFVVTTPATGHGTLEYTPAGTVSLHKSSTAAHWSCPDCETLFSDAEGTTEIEAVVVIPAAHPLTYDEGTPATCTGNGELAHYYCEACDKNFEDENGDDELDDSELTILASGHRLSPVTETPANCYAKGELAHYHCGVCGKDYSDADTENELTDLTIAVLDHSISKVESKDPTCTVDGYEEYWLCANCNDMFYDEAGTEKLDFITTIPAIGYHTWSEYPVYNEEGGYVATQCSVCHDEKDKLAVIDHTGGLSANTTTIELGATYYTHNTNTSQTSTSVMMGISNFSLPAEGDFEIRFSYLDNKACAIVANRSSVKLSGTNTAIFASATAVKNDYKNNFTLEFDSHNRLTKLVIKVDGETVKANDVVNLVLSASAEKDETRYILICVTQPGEVYYGVNSIEVTAAGASADLSTDNYKFVPTETKAYSITVPAGVDAILSTGEEVKGGDNGDYINFNATAGQPITITFLASKVGSYNITIGEKGNYMFTPDISYTGLNVPTKKQDGDVISGGITVLEVGDIEEGTYIITVTVSAGLGRSSLFFGVNPTSTDYLTFTGVAANGNYSTQNYEGLADVIFYTGIQYDRNNCASFNAANRYAFKVTLQLKKGDTLVFAHTNTTDGSVSVSMEAAPNED